MLKCVRIPRKRDQPMQVRRVVVHYSKKSLSRAFPIRRERRWDTDNALFLVCRGLRVAVACFGPTTGPPRRNNLQRSHHGKTRTTPYACKKATLGQRLQAELFGPVWVTHQRFGIE